jgi:uncharacterized membrane protein
MIPAEAFALASGFFSAVNMILLKKGLARSNVITAIVVSLTINVIVFWTLVWMVVPHEEIWRAELFIFILVGLIQPGGTRFLSYLSVQKVGVAITAPLRATTPLFSSLFAILILGENLTVPVAVGTLLVVSGVIIISLKDKGTVVFRKLYIFLPLLSALVAGSTQVIRKIGLVHVPFPLLGAAVATGTSLLVVTLSLITSKKLSMLTFNRTSLWFFALAGITVTLSAMSVYMSLHLSDVVIVAPLTSLSPLYSLILAAVFLRDLEVITPRIVTSACLIVLGVVLITALR